MSFASPQRILADLTASRNHVWLTTGIRCVYQRDDANWNAFEQLWEGECNQVERNKDEPLPPTYRGRFNADGGVFFFKGTDNEQLFTLIRAARELVNHPGIEGKIRLFYSQQLAAITATFMADISTIPKDKPLILAGHSYGGVMAILLGQLAKNAGWSNVRVFTYGMPRPGDRDFNQGNSVVHIRSVLAGDGITEYGQDDVAYCFLPMLSGTSDVDAFSNHGRKFTLHPFTGTFAQIEGSDQTQNADAFAYYYDAANCWRNSANNARIWVWYTRATHPIRVYQNAWVLNNMAREGVAKPVRVRVASLIGPQDVSALMKQPENDVMSYHRVVRRQEQLEPTSAHKLPLPSLQLLAEETQTVVTRRMMRPLVVR